MIFATQAWAGPSSTTDDLMSQLQDSRVPFVPEPEPGVFAVPAECSAEATIEAANQDMETSGLPFSKPWVVFNKPELLRETFSFKKTLNHIINSSSGAERSTSPAELMSSMIDSQSLTSATNPASGLETPLDARFLENQINAQAAVDEWFPVGVFNRLDTAPSDGSHCGEYRIVYANPGFDAIHPSLQDGDGRFFTIFEAAIPNPQPDKGILGCLPIAEFWASLADPSLSDRIRVDRLEEFFYQGINVSSSNETVSIEPVVKFSHYQAPLGQVRTNEFLDSRWQLREFKTAVNENGKAIFAVETVKNNALTEFYNLESFFPSENPDNLSLFDELSIQFQDVFVTELLHQLTSADEIAPQDEIAFINRISMIVPNKFNEFQSDSQFPDDDITQNTGNILRSRITNELDTIRTNTTPEHILNRAEAMSCGGCHEFSNHRVIGDFGDGTEIRWPVSGGFVHIDEGGNLSPALTETFLPAREKVLINFVCANPSPPPPPPPPPPSPPRIVGIVFIAEGNVEIDRPSFSAGDIYANNDIKFDKGSRGTHIGDLIAAGDIKIGKRNTISGDVIAGNKVVVDRNSTVTGTVIDNTGSFISLPTVTPFASGKEDIKVESGEILSLTPGSYDDVRANEGATLQLVSGEYFLEELDLRDFAVLEIDVSNGPATIHVEKKLEFDNEVEVRITPFGEDSSDLVTFKQLGRKTVEIDKGARVLGTIIAPKAKVKLKNGSFFKGAIIAQSIEVKPHVTFFPHDF